MREAEVNREPNVKRRANAQFEIQGWDEKPIHDAPKMTRASIAHRYSGDIEGGSMLEYLMVYRDDGAASFVGLERIEGSLGGKKGAFVVQHTGVFEGGMAKVAWKVVPGAATGELKGLTGEAHYETGHAKSHAVVFEYELG